MREWLLEIERILAGEWAATPEELTRSAVEQRLDGWQARLKAHLHTGGEHPEEVRCLSYLLKVVTHLRPWLTHCYAVTDLPRTNNEMELLIRGIKTRYRRISGRKNWNAYLLRYRCCAAYLRTLDEPTRELREPPAAGCSKTVATGSRGVSHKPQAATQSLSLPSSASRVFGCFRGPMGASLLDVSIAPTV
jgi:hypothetical protein